MGSGSGLVVRARVRVGVRVRGRVGVRVRCRVRVRVAANLDGARAPGRP